MKKNLTFKATLLLALTLGLGNMKNIQGARTMNVARPQNDYLVFLQTQRMLRRQAAQRVVEASFAFIRENVLPNDEDSQSSDSSIEPRNLEEDLNLSESLSEISTDNGFLSISSIDSMNRETVPEEHSIHLFPLKSQEEFSDSENFEDIAVHETKNSTEGYKQIIEENSENLSSSSDEDLKNAHEKPKNTMTQEEIMSQFLQKLLNKKPCQPPKKK